MIKVSINKMQLINNKRTFQNSFLHWYGEEVEFSFLKGIFLNMNYQKDLKWALF